MNYPTNQANQISNRRLQYPINERLIVYDAESMQRKLENKYNSTENDDMLPLNQSKNSVLMVNGTNILNKNSVDCDTAMNRIIQRRKTHNRVERRRRDRMNNLFSELSSIIPSAIRLNKYPNRADILQEAILYIRQLQNENQRPSLSSKSPSFEFDDTGSLSSYYDSSLMSSPPLSNNMMYMPSPTNTMMPLVHERKRSTATLRPQHLYESIISFN